MDKITSVAVKLCINNWIEAVLPNQGTHTDITSKV